MGAGCEKAGCEFTGKGSADGRCSDGQLHIPLLSCSQMVPTGHSDGHLDGHSDGQ